MNVVFCVTAQIVSHLGGSLLVKGDGMMFIEVISYYQLINFPL